MLDRLTLMLHRAAVTRIAAVAGAVFAVGACGSDTLTLSTGPRVPPQIIASLVGSYRITDLNGAGMQPEDITRGSESVRGWPISEAPGRKVLVTDDTRVDAQENNFFILYLVIAVDDGMQITETTQVQDGIYQLSGSTGIAMELSDESLYVINDAAMRLSLDVVLGLDIDIDDLTEDTAYQLNLDRP